MIKILHINKLLNEVLSQIFMYVLQVKKYKNKIMMRIHISFLYMILVWLI